MNTVMFKSVNYVQVYFKIKVFISLLLWVLLFFFFPQSKLENTSGFEKLNFSVTMKNNIA